MNDEIVKRGRGRPPGSKNDKTLVKEADQARQRELFNQKVDLKWDAIIGAQITSALIPGREGNEPRKYIIDQRIGRPTEQIKIEGEVDLHMDF